MVEEQGAKFAPFTKIYRGLRWKNIIQDEKYVSWDSYWGLELRICTEDFKRLPPISSNGNGLNDVMIRIDDKVPTGTLKILRRLPYECLWLYMWDNKCGFQEGEEK